MQDKELARSAVAEHELEHEHYDRPAFFDEAMYGQAVEEALEASCETFLCLAETDLNQLPQPAAPANEAPDPQQAMVALRLPFLRNTQAAERERVRILVLQSRRTQR